MTTVKKTAAKKSATVTPITKKTKRVAGKPKTPPAKMVHKVLTIICSVGDENRGETLAEFEAKVKKSIAKTGARNIVRTGGYYILDGKVCLEQDYDEAAQNFKEGATPPPWAGGPMGNAAVERSTGGEQKGVMPEPAKPRTPTEALRDLHENTDWGRKKRAEQDAAARARRVEEISDDELEWEDDDVTDTEKMEKVADESTAKSLAKLKGTKKKIVVKSKTGDVAPPKKTVTKKTVKAPVKKKGTK